MLFMVDLSQKPIRLSEENWQVGTIAFSLLSKKITDVDRRNSCDFPVTLLRQADRPTIDPEGYLSSSRRNRPPKE